MDSSTEPPIEPSTDRALFAERLLLREFTHRVNNELTFAMSSITLAASRCDSSEARRALVAVHDRLQNFAQVHHSLQLPDHSTTIEATAYLHSLCGAISRSRLEGWGIELSLSLHPLRMSSERCWHLGMIVFELITNAARHAFAHGPGRIRLELLPSGTSVECRVTDNGSCDAEIRRGTGLKIVEALAGRLHGTVDVQPGPRGTRSILIFPLHG